ncbi:hypothetical protein [Polluticaenibacter yanchengensis]|uniref:DUF4878 domain-containing protein n=1 Tax=Polluticaenibacter yanchengensis TaxID=3014562 RepID=A0ABT4UFM4_9BACT|nr:hypothetical protein [Chitinophagaceae bacterium LY-5]
MNSSKFTTLFLLISLLYISCNNTPGLPPDKVGEQAVRHLINLEFDEASALSTEESLFNLNLVKSGIILAKAASNKFDSVLIDLRQSTIESKILSEKNDSAWVSVNFRNSKNFKSESGIKLLLLKRSNKWFVNFDSNFLFAQ